LPRTLDPGVPLWVGIVRQVTAKRQTVILSMIRNTNSKKVLLSPQPGNEFLITLLVSGKIPPQNRTFRFGKRMASSSFEETNIS
jgi:hypothetical protein